jgi:hypothetical protein
MPEHESTRWAFARRGAARRHARRAVIGQWILTAVWLAATGCNSAYQRTQKVLPPEPGAQLTRRVEEARHAEKLAAQAGTRLRDDLVRGVSGETIQADMDRLEMAALELQRRTAAVRDATTSANGTQELGSEIERLQLCSKALSDYVLAARQAGPATQLAQLDDLLRGPTAPAHR